MIAERVERSAKRAILCLARRTTVRELVPLSVCSIFYSFLFFYDHAAKSVRRLAIDESGSEETWGAGGERERKIAARGSNRVEGSVVSRVEGKRIGRSIESPTRNPTISPIPSLSSRRFASFPLEGAHRKTKKKKKKLPRLPFYHSP